MLFFNESMTLQLCFSFLLGSARCHQVRDMYPIFVIPFKDLSGVQNFLTFAGMWSKVSEDSRRTH